mmetsp:Transcript_1385/g.3357  ORF Transcript_1385/g.3357 Transcript_1385/m.3357 type:complete len:663 (-) Transcript_1385:31-2019(-)
MEGLTFTDVGLQEQVVRLEHEKRTLEDYARRVTIELRRYQQSRPTPPTREDDDMPLPPWATNMQMMAPLLFAYEERIAELEAVIERSVSLAEQAQVMTRENDSLRVELQERTEQLRNAQLLAPAAHAAAGGREGGAEEELRELHRISVEQNEALAQQNQLLKLQLERMQQGLAVGQQRTREQLQKAELQLRDAQTRATEGTQAYASEQERAEALARQRGAAEHRLEEVTGELVEEVNVREQLQSQVESLEQRLRLQTESLELYKKSFEDRSAADKEDEKGLRQESERLMRREKELQQRVDAQERELGEVREQLVAARRDDDAARREERDMLGKLYWLERKIQDVNEQHGTVQARLIEEESKAGALQLEKDCLTTSEQALKRQSERLESRLQGEVEALRQQGRSEVENMQKSHERVLSETEERLRRSEQAAAELTVKADLAERHRAWEAAALERQTSLQAAERERFQGDLEDMQQTRLRLERQSDAAQQEVARLRAELEAASSEVREERAKVGAEVSSCRSRCQSTERLLNQARQEAQACEAQASGSSAECARILAELGEEQHRANEALEAERRRAQAEKRAFERQLLSVRSKSHQEEQRAAELLRAQEALRLRWHSEVGMEKEALEAQVERLSRDNRAMRERSRSVLKAFALRGPAGLGMAP